MKDDIIKVAAVQAAPVFLDIEATVDKACALIVEAGQAGAKLIGFPESFVPAFPFWIFKTHPMGGAADLYLRLQENAMTVGDQHMAKVARAAREAGIYVCLSVTEKEGGSLYLTQFWFDASGNLAGKHRKLKPSGPERYIWGEGDGSMMPVLETPFGNLGGLQCWEHMVPVNLAAMAALNEQIHVASWPGGAFTKGGPFEALTEKRTTLLGIADQGLNPVNPSEIASRYYALSTQTFVIKATHVVAQDAIDGMAEAIDVDGFRTGGGKAQIISPDGVRLSDPMPENEEGLVYADIAPGLVDVAKYMLDTGGHYSAPSVLSLNFDREPKRPLHISGDGGTANTQTYEELTKSREA